MDHMNWVNLEVRFLSSEVMVEASHEVRSTWLALIAWCVQQENGGRIVGAKNWQAMKWLKIVGAEPEHLTEKNSLYWFDGDDLVVYGYPVEQEKAYMRKKAICKAASEAKQRKRKVVVHDGVHDGIHDGADNGHHKEKEDNGIGKKNERKTKAEYEQILGMEIPLLLSERSSFYLKLKSHPRYSGRLSVDDKLKELYAYNQRSGKTGEWLAIDLVAFCENDME